MADSCLVVVGLVACCRLFGSRPGRWLVRGVGKQARSTWRKEEDLWEGGMEGDGEAGVSARVLLHQLLDRAPWAKAPWAWCVRWDGRGLLGRPVGQAHSGLWGGAHLRPMLASTPATRLSSICGGGGGCGRARVLAAQCVEVGLCGVCTERAFTGKSGEEGECKRGGECERARGPWERRRACQVGASKGKQEVACPKPCMSFDKNAQQQQQQQQQRE